ncbi:hypothetical protein [Rathayibacter caricis]|uniref:hypothetical protein n=1 Tax=Rathayibacter caricis TaxID=110936 RepID=UPI001FD29623|nr:hypothetical protein [Rathayibacter caricis]
MARTVQQFAGTVLDHGYATLGAVDQELLTSALELALFGGHSVARVDFYDGSGNSLRPSWPWCVHITVTRQIPRR